MTGNPLVDKIILGLNALAVTAAAGMVYYAHNMIERPTTDQGGQMKELVMDSMKRKDLSPVTFPKMVVNLYSRETRLRFLDLQLNLEVFEEEDKVRINNFKPVILDALIDIAGNMTPEELNSVTGRILLESRLKSKINDQLRSQVVRKIYFSRFIIQ